MTDVIVRSVVQVDGDASGLSVTMAEVAQETGKAKKTLENLGRGASQSLNKAADEGTRAGKKLERSTQSLINQIERQIAVTQAGARGTASFYRELAKQRGVDVEHLKPYLAQLEAVTAKQGQARAALQATAPAMAQVGASAKQLAAATRGLPAQFTDIAVSLQAGQRPLTVLLQQGGQLKDMFGGVGPAARAMGGYIAGLVNPFTLSAAAVGLLGAAYLKGSAEAQAFNRTLIETGGAAGVTASQLQNMARRASAVIGTQGKAAEVLNLFAASAKVGTQNMEQFTVAAVRWEKVTGAAVEDTVQHFVDLGKAPLDAALKLNEGMNFLTAATYEQIRALERQGKAAEAASVAQRAYADALNDRAPKLSQNLGLLERAWKGVSDTARGAWDAMLDIGRETPLQDRISKQAATVQVLENKLHQRLVRGMGTGNLGELIKAAVAEQERLERSYFDIQRKAQADQARKKLLDQAQFRADYLDDDSRSTRLQQRQRAIDKETVAFQRAIEGLKKGTEEYRRIYSAHKTALAEIDKRYEDRDAKRGHSGAESEAARLRARITEEKALAVELEQRGLHTSKLNEYERRSAEIGELLKGNLKSQVRASLERTKALAAEAGALVRANAETKAFQESREKYFASLEDGVSKIAREAQSVEDQVATYGMSKAALEQLTIARLEERKAVLQGFDGSEREVELIEKEIDARKRLGAAIRQKDIKDAQKKAADEMARDWERTVDKYGDVFRQGFADMMNNGKKGWKSFTTSLATTFKTTVADQIYRLLAQPFVVRIAAGLVSLAGAGSAGIALAAPGGLLGATGGSTQALSLLSAGKNAYSLATGGFAAVGQQITDLGVKLGSQWVADFGYGFGQGANAAATTAGTVGQMAGVASGAALGFLGGKLISGKYAVGNANLTVGAGTAAGAALGSIVPGIGTALGATLGGLLGGVVNRAFGRGPKRFGDTTLVGEVGAFGFSGYTSTPWKQKGGWFSRGRSGQQVGVLDRGLMHDLTAAFELMKRNAASLATAVGLSARSLDAYSEQIRVKLTKDERENQRLLEAAIAAVGENMVRSLVPNIAVFSKEGETASQTLGRLGGNLAAVNQSLKRLDLKLLDISVAGAATASKLVDAFGSIDVINRATSQYYQLYYSETERAKLSLAHVADALKSVNVAMPDSMQALRSIVSMLDLTTDAGRKAYVALIAIAPEFAAAMEATTRRAQETAARMVEAFAGRGRVVPEMSGAAVNALLLDDALSRVSRSTGQVSRQFLDLTAGLVDFTRTTAVAGDAISGAQQVSLTLTDEIERLRLSVGGAVIDFSGLKHALEGVDTDVFVAVITAVLQRLAERLRAVLDGIGNERIAVRQAAKQVLDPVSMTPSAIRKAIEGTFAVMPSTAGVSVAAERLNVAEDRYRQQLSARHQAEQAYRVAKATHDGTEDALVAARQRVADAQARVDKLSWDIYAPKTVPYKKKNWKELDAARSAAQAQLPAAKEVLAQAQAALVAAQAAAAVHSAQDISGLHQAYADAVTKTASAQAVATEAATKARHEQAAYTVALQQFVLDAEQSVGKLGELRAETVRYYEAQKALASVLAEGAKGLRKTVKDYRVSQLSPEDQFAILQRDFSQAYAKAMGSDGDALVRYADELNSLFLPVLEAAKGAFASDGQYQAFLATTWARVEAVADRMDAVAPKDYQNQSLDLLSLIDQKLAALERSALSGDQVIANAINASRDATVNGLRQVVNAVAGKSIAAFAAGGEHTGGLRLVGERGPELEVTGPSRIFSASETRSILSGSPDQGQIVDMLRLLLQENQALRQEVANLRIEARATASNTGKAVRRLDRIEADGLVVRPDSGEPLRVEVIAE
ncbi:phage tail length tape measure family protein [Bordetella avium]|nr:phage tail length tape measure family protein [Bordetella avium]AZY48859.1 phage tail protein [Bordetella avium]AZY52239.1 phage tail protein [Bordetella avium]RIQ47782.1 phage tail protein [Bordetella avium]RIQ71048.1 phage tail protein [Bordetella avium]